MGVFAPAATPKEAVERLSAEIIRVMQLPEVRAGLERDGFIVAPTGPAEYQAFVRARMKLIAKIAADAKLKVE